MDPHAAMSIGSTPRSSPLPDSSSEDATSSSRARLRLTNSQTVSRSSMSRASSSVSCEKVGAPERIVALTHLWLLCRRRLDPLCPLGPRGPHRLEHLGGLGSSPAWEDPAGRWGWRAQGEHGPGRGGALPGPASGTLFGKNPLAGALGGALSRAGHSLFLRRLLCDGGGRT